MKEVDTVLTAGEIVDIITKAELDESVLNGERFEELYPKYASLGSLSTIQEHFFFENYIISKHNEQMDEENKESIPAAGPLKLRTNAFDKNSSHSYLETMVRGVTRDVYKAPDSSVSLQYKFGKNQDIEVSVQ